MKKSWTEQEYQILRDNLHKVNRMYDMCGLLPGRTYSAIKRISCILGLVKNKRYIKNENFFDTPDSLNSSVAGFIASDGHLDRRKKNGSTICIIISNKDKSILEKVIKITNSDSKVKDFFHKSIAPLRSGEKKEYNNLFSSLHFYNAANWVDNLNTKWNIPIGKKSLSIKAPDISDIEASLGYIIGLINGDGTIYLDKSRYERLTVSMLGTEDLLNWCKTSLEKFLNKKLETVVRKERQSSNIYILKICGIDASRLIDKAASMNVVLLDRKWKNSNILSRIEKYKSKFPHLFISQFPPESVKPVAITNLN